MDLSLLRETLLSPPVLSFALGAGRGRRTGDEITGVFQNCYLMAVCIPDIAERIVEIVRPILKRFRGIALVSDCLWVKH